MAAHDRAPQGDRPPQGPGQAGSSRRERREVAGGEPGTNSRPEEAVAGGEPELWTAVSGLPPKQRSAVVLRFATDMSYAGIAQTLDCSQAAARRSVHEGLAKVREVFA